MRRNIFELLQNNKISFYKEYSRLHYLFEEKTYYYYGERTVCSHINSDCFKKWEYRKRCINIEEMKEILEIDDNNMKSKLDMARLLRYIEFIVNILDFSIHYIKCDDFKSIRTTIYENVIDLLDDINYEFIKNDKGQYIIIEKNNLSTAIAEAIPSITNTVIEYRRFSLKGDIESKRKILRELANKVEPLEKKFRGTEFKSFIDDLQTMLNNLNIRHNNVEGKNKKQYVINMNNEDLEGWYDKIYDMILIALLIDKYIDDKSKIKELKEYLK